MTSAARLPDNALVGGSRQIVAIRAAAFAVAFLSIAAALLTPIYTDEVAWRILGRAWIDGVDRGLSPTCLSGFVARPPLFMWPARMLSGLIAEGWPSPVAVRLQGVASFAIWLALLWMVIGRVMPAGQADRFRLVAFSAMALGVMPFVMAVSRPEQPLLLALTATVLVVVNAGRLAPSRANFFALAAIVVLAAVALSYHPKAAVYGPLFLLAVPFCGAARMPVPRAIAAAAIAAMITVAFLYWRQRLQCPEDPVLAGYFKDENMLSRLFGGEPIGKLLPTMIGLAWPEPYVRNILPWPSHMSDWLPRRLVDPSALPWALLTGVAWFAVIASLVVALATRFIRAKLAALKEPPVLFSVAILITVIGWSSLQANKNSYESALALPMLLLAFCLAFASTHEGEDGSSSERRANAAAWLSAGAAALSLGALCYYYVPTLYRLAGTPGYLPGQLYSTNVFQYSRARVWVEAAARQCSIPTDGSARGVAVDDLSYFTFVSTPELHYRTGLFRFWRGSLDDPARWLLDHGSAGIVQRCEDMPAGLRRNAARVGSVCCLNRSMMTKALADPEHRFKPTENRY